MERTIEDLHSKDYGHRKFAKVCDILVSQNYEVTNINEFYEKFRFDVDGYWFEYQKDWKSSAQSFVDYLLNMLKMKKIMSKEPIRKMEI